MSVHAAHGLFCRCQEPALKAAYTLAWANVPIVVVVALLVPIYMFSGESCLALRGGWGGSCSWGMLLTGGELAGLTVCAVLPCACAVHDYNMLTMTSLWLVPVIPGTAAAAVTGAVSKVTLHHDQAVALLYPGTVWV